MYCVDSLVFISIVGIINYVLFAINDTLLTVRLSPQLTCIYCKYPRIQNAY